MRLLALSATILALTLTACGGGDDESAAPESTPTSSEAPEAITVDGSLEVKIDNAQLFADAMKVPDREQFQVGVSRCFADGGAVEEGSQVVVKNADGTTVATGALDGGLLGDDGQAPISSPCVFGFSVEVPTDSDFYSFEVGALEPVTVEAAELAEPLVIDAT